MTKDPNEISAAGRALGSIGGKARADKLTAERRREIARMGGYARSRKPVRENRRCFALSNPDYRMLKRLGEGSATEGLARMLEHHRECLGRQAEESEYDENYSELIE